MKFNYQATILMGTVALASIFNAGQANALECVPKSVPWRWELERSQSSYFYFFANAQHNRASFPAYKEDLENITGAYIVKLLFDEPSNYCEKLGNAPTQTSLQIEGFFEGFLDNVESNPRPPLGQFTTANAFVDILPKFEQVSGFSLGKIPINQNQKTVMTVGDGNRISFAGFLYALAYQDSVAAVSFNVNGTLIGATSGSVIYTVPVPEPLTILGSATGLGFAAFFKRKHSKKQKKS